MDKAAPGTLKREEPHEEQKEYQRFSLSERIEHGLLLVSFTILGITGLAQKFASSQIAQNILELFGGIEKSRTIHHIFAVVLLTVSIYHILAAFYRIFVLRRTLSMLPVPQDFVHLYQDILFYLGRRARKAYYGRYSYAEKVEYLAVVWGTMIMAITGFMMWNPIATTRWLPGEFIPAAKAAHGGEALLAVLAIILWHFYHVHLRSFNKSMFTGKLSEEEMKEEHPAELAMFKAGTTGKRPPIKDLRRREQIYYPVAALVTVVLGFGLFRFVTFEQTAILTVPRGETAPIFVPFTPTPSPTPAPTPTSAPGGIVANSWDDGVSQLLNERCGNCHVQATASGLSLATYQDALKGGSRGPAIVPGDTQASILVQVQSAGGHPGQLSDAELAKIVDWINAGAPEK
jgi:cytochrome b subunit of formate dehydrogenase